MKPDFKNAKIYKIVSYQTDKIYIGSTTSRLSKRLSEHKAHYKCYLKGKYAYMTSFEIVKFDDCDIILIESVECNLKDELHARERYYIELHDCVNKNVPTRTVREYYIDNKERILDNMKQKCVCVCGGKYTHVHKQRHSRSITHQQYMLQIQFEAFIQTNPTLDDAVKHIQLFH